MSSRLSVALIAAGMASLVGAQLGIAFDIDLAAIIGGFAGPLLVAAGCFAARRFPAAIACTTALAAAIFATASTAGMSMPSMSWGLRAAYDAYPIGLALGVALVIIGLPERAIAVAIAVAAGVAQLALLPPPVDIEDHLPWLFQLASAHPWGAVAVQAVVGVVVLAAARTRPR